MDCVVGANDLLIFLSFLNIIVQIYSKKTNFASLKTKKQIEMKYFLTTALFAIASCGVFAQTADNQPNNNMQSVYDFLKQAGTYFIATTEGDQPRVRPFGTVNIFEDKLYIQTGRSKNVGQQILANPKIEICALVGSEWLRVEATALEDARTEAKESMLDAYPSLKKMYSATDSNTLVLYLTDVTATFYGFGSEPRTVTFGGK
ncbi:hypothetical protein FACS189413_02560 [Bacteroidia bacterium]|nr:hypothetical protein FACS189413_02560 [Bacteroidia bacterium]